MHRSTSFEALPAVAPRLRLRTGGWVLLAILLAGLTACGGGGGASKDDDSAAAEALPTSTETRQTGRPLDLALAGEGAFILGDPDSGERLYSRLGRFDIDADGWLIHAEGGRAQGAPPSNEPIAAHPDDARADAMEPTGVPASAAIEAAPLVAVRAMAPAATTRLTLVANLDGRSLAAEGGPFDPDDSRTYNFATTFALHDAEGRSARLTAFFRCNERAIGYGAESHWEVHWQVGGVQLPSPPIVLRFDSSGRPVRDAAAERRLEVPVVTMDDGTAFGPLASVALELDEVSNYGSLFSVYQSETDGHGPGTLQAAQIDAEGMLWLDYDNGQRRQGGQLLLAKFTVADRLHRRGDSAWVCGADCGAPIVDRPGRQLLGGLVPGALNTVY